MNYAQEFKSAFENNDANRMALICREWDNDSPDDANFTLAALMLMLMSGDVPSRKSARMLIASDYQRPLDESLHGWYEDAAIGIMEKRIAENIMENPALASRFAGSKKMDIDNDNMYAGHFIWLLDKAGEGRQDIGSRKIDDLMDDLIIEWSYHFPDDANLTCAGVIRNIESLSVDEIRELIMKAKSQEAIDKASHSQLLSIMIEKATEK